MRALALYGKGGIGKSTLASNIAAALGGRGVKTLLVGCDPKADSTINLLGRRIQPLLEVMREEKRPPPERFTMVGFNGVSCVEIGGPEPGVGCAGRGLIIGIRYLIEALDLEEFDLVIFDVPADIVCGGLAVVVKEGYAESALVVTSDEFMSLYAANNLCRGFTSIGAKVGGLLYNRASERGRAYVEAFSEKVGLPILGSVPLSDEIKNADRARRTMIETDPSSAASAAMISLADSVYKSRFSVIPKWIPAEDLEAIFVGDA
ncbi:MAG: P-loop NTPase [Candidatus Methanosuratincola sp.]|jgi:nitrogenase subunit NifH|uniref:Nitrogenase iron protein n=2 Tax=Candidatus Methanosuratincola (ex Vanwonterghem et al. 2016) TaxID=1915412 RepID=A0A7J3UZX6_9CREN|nr:P-loop NTPase [Candidatus Methanosuratincola sp.]MCQ8892609.1 P-loop NTPase [Candidatus Methanosuratincola sp.]RWX74157.1 MAG: Nitrogenase (molybdenum-iron) reductase and maturation protein NifH [Candidatus Methanosuratincola subterraneus]